MCWCGVSRPPGFQPRSNDLVVAAARTGPGVAATTTGTTGVTPTAVGAAAGFLGGAARVFLTLTLLTLFLLAPATLRFDRSEDRRNLGLSRILGRIGSAVSAVGLGLRLLVVVAVQRALGAVQVRLRRAGVGEDPVPVGTVHGVD